jgi:hypothetical protein
MLVARWLSEVVKLRLYRCPSPLSELNKARGMNLYPETPMRLPERSGAITSNADFLHMHLPTVFAVPRKSCR